MEEFTFLSNWLLWLIAAAILVIVELLTNTFAAFCLVGGCALALATSLIGFGIEAQLTAAAIGSVLSFIAFKPLTKRQAEAAKQSEILKAEGESRAKILQAEGEAEAIRRVADAIKETKTDPATYMLAVKYIETLEKMVNGKDGKTVYIPYEASGILSSIGSIRDMFQK